MLDDGSSTFQTNASQSDVTLKCELVMFKAHKDVLTAKSPFFSTMFETSKPDDLGDCVDIKDVKPEIFRLVLEYIYKDTIRQVGDAQMACHLLSAAVLYQLPGLRKICVDYLKRTVSNRNVLSVMEFADSCDEDLRKHTLTFMCNHYDYVTKTAEWEALKIKNPFLVLEIMSSKIDFMELEIHEMNEHKLTRINSADECSKGSRSA